MTLIQAIVLGIVQGLTEYLPISSSAHLRIVPALLHWEDPGAAFSAIIQLGTALAVVVYFAKDLTRIIGAALSGLFKGKPFENQDAKMAWIIALGTVPVVIAGVLLKHRIEGAFRGLYVTASALILLALVLWIAEKRARHLRSLDSVGFDDGLAVGAAQMLALVPGVSRSGVTLTAGLFRGLTREAAARFSFLLAIPSTIGAALFELRDAFKENPDPHLALAPLAIATVISFVVGFLAIAGLLRYLRTRTTTIFVVYRIALGVAILILLRMGFLTP